MGDKKSTYITINKKEVLCTYHDLDILQLQYHPGNPRIASVLAKYNGNITDELIDSTLWDKDSTHNLKRNIEKHGGLLNPIVVFQNKVIEGNTRLCCYRHLYSEHKDEKWRYINCKILVGDVTQKELTALLGNEHIVGKTQWDPYEKAYWMTTMNVKDNYSTEEIAGIVGQGKAWVENHIKAYQLMKSEKVEDISKFSYFYQIVSNNDIKDISKNVDPDVVPKLVTAIKNDQFTDAREIRKVPTLYKDKKSVKKVFGKGEKFDQAYHDLKSKKPTIDSTFIRSVDDISDRIQNMKITEREEIKKNNQNKYSIKKLTKSLIKLCNQLEIDIHVPGHK